MTDIPALIARVRELDAAAMPGPWSYIAQPKSSEYLTSVFGADDTEVFYSTAEARRHEHANAALAAEYRTAAPALATALEVAMAERDALRRHYDEAGPEHNLLALLDLYEERRREAMAENERLREALRTVVVTGVPGGSICARRGDEHKCGWCRGMWTPCPVATARLALEGK